MTWHLIARHGNLFYEADGSVFFRCAGRDLDGRRT